MALITSGAIILLALVLGGRPQKWWAPVLLLLIWSTTAPVQYIVLLRAGPVEFRLDHVVLIAVTLMTLNGGGLSRRFGALEYTLIAYGIGVAATTGLTLTSGVRQNLLLGVNSSVKILGCVVLYFGARRSITALNVNGVLASITGAALAVAVLSVVAVLQPSQWLLDVTGAGADVAAFSGLVDADTGGYRRGLVCFGEGFMLAVYVLLCVWVVLRIPVRRSWRTFYLVSAGCLGARSMTTGSRALVITYVLVALLATGSTSLIRSRFRGSRRVPARLYLVPGIALCAVGYAFTFGPETTTNLKVRFLSTMYDSVDDSSRSTLGSVYATTSYALDRVWDSWQTATLGHGAMPEIGKVAGGDIAGPVAVLVAFGCFGLLSATAVCLAASARCWRMIRARAPAMSPEGAAVGLAALITLLSFLLVSAKGAMVFSTYYWNAPLFFVLGAADSMIVRPLRQPQARKRLQRLRVQIASQPPGARGLTTARPSQMAARRIRN